MQNTVTLPFTAAVDCIFAFQTLIIAVTVVHVAASSS